MPSATKDRDEKAMASTAVSPGDDEARDERPRGPPPEPAKVDGGFFHIYKKGQGKWTRLGTAGGGALIGLLCAEFIYSQLKTYTIFQIDGRPRISVILGIVGALFAGYAALIFWLMNKPRNA